MRILPITNSQTNIKPAFKQFGSTAYEAEMILNNYKKVTSYHFLNGGIHNGLAQLDYTITKNAQNLKKLYSYAISILRVESHERRPDIAIRLGLVNNNYPYLRILIDEMGVIPIDPMGEIPTDILITGKTHPDRRIRELFDDEYLRRKTSVLGWGAWDENRLPYEIIEGKDIFDEMMNRPKSINQIKLPPRRINRDTVIQQVKSIINADEENYGYVSLPSIYNIVKDSNFSLIKNEPLNISGSKILHLLSEIYINPNNEREIQILKEIINECKNINYNFNITNDFGETALDKAREAENRTLMKLLEKIQRR